MRKSRLLFYILWGKIKDFIVNVSIISRDDIFLYLKGSKLVDDLCLKKSEFGVNKS